MRIIRGFVLGVLLATTAVASVDAAPLRPEDARRFVAGKLFAYSCFEGTRGMGRIFPDGSVVGTVQPAGKAVRFVALPAGTVRVSSSSICASVKGMMFTPCFEVNQTSAQSFRGSLSGLGFAYCDFVRQNPRTRVTGTGSAISTGAAGTAVATPKPQPIDLRGTTHDTPAPQPAVVAHDN